MAQIEIIIRDNDGTIIHTAKELSYDIDLGSEKFTDIFVPSESPFSGTLRLWSMHFSVS